jgi:hypothetical protein
MGTRGLTKVVINNETKVAQYGQWDHNPSGQGVVALNFLKNFNEEHFRTQLTKCKFVDKDKENEIENFLKSIGSNNGWMTMEQSDKYKREYPYLSRDNGAHILNLINESTDDVIWIHDSSSFIEDGLFCEGAFIIDLDKRTLTVHWNGENVFDIDNLPDTETFINTCEIEEEEN